MKIHFGVFRVYNTYAVTRPRTTNSMIAIRLKLFQSYRTQIGCHHQLKADWQSHEGSVQDNVFQSIPNMLRSQSPNPVQCTADSKENNPINVCDLTGCAVAMNSCDFLRK